MEQLKQESQNTKGFSLIEIVVALVILSTSIIVIYQVILSTSISVYSIEDKYLAKEVTNNRVALMNTLEKPLRPQTRDGKMIMGGKEWIWEEEYILGASKEFLEFTILVKREDSESYAYKFSGYIVNE